ncbi:hypothetical protein V3G39_07965 [Dermatophilaceae bacterium Sec6.4]
MAVGAVDLESPSNQLLHESASGGPAGAGDENATILYRELQTLSHLAWVRMIL